jgi:hypothetical protein
MLNSDVTRMQNDPIVSRASELMRLGLMPSTEQVQGGFVRLEQPSHALNSDAHLFSLGFVLD